MPSRDSSNERSDITRLTFTRPSRSKRGRSLSRSSARFQVSSLFCLSFSWSTLVIRSLRIESRFLLVESISVRRAVFTVRFSNSQRGLVAVKLGGKRKIRRKKQQQLNRQSILLREKAPLDLARSGSAAGDATAPRKRGLSSENETKSRGLFETFAVRSKQTKTERVLFRNRRVSFMAFDYSPSRHHVIKNHIFNQFTE